MDFSKFKTHDWLVVGGGIGIFVFGFLDWVTVSASGFGVSVSTSGGNVFDFFWTGTLPWILLIASAVITVLLVMEVLSKDQAPWPLIILGATALAALLLLIRFIFNPLEGADAAGLDVGRGIGMILSVISGLAAAAGGFLGFRESGGDIKDLTDMDKLKSSFSKSGNGGSSSSGDDMPPPPPPPPPPAPPSPPQN